MYLWLQSVEGPFAGGCTNSKGGQYQKYDSSDPLFYDMCYVEHPVYADPGSNHWIGNQVWSTQRLAELYYYVKKNGDLQLAGEIVAFDQFNKGISSDGYSSQIQLKMTVNVRFVNNKKHTDDFERQFSATADYDASQQLVAVQEELVTQMTKDITDQIFNAAVANW